MTVHIVIPVFNRLGLTKTLVNCLRNQNASQPIEILIVNDGSTDGTAEWLKGQADLKRLDGDGSLFWGGAVDCALKHLMPTLSKSDWVLLMNNDTTVDEDYVQNLYDVAVAEAPAAVGSIVRDVADKSRVLSIGAKIDAWRFYTNELTMPLAFKDKSTFPLQVDILSGRGALFPAHSLIKTGGMRKWMLPHYLADYELSLRVQKAGWKLVVASAAVYSAEEFGSMQRHRTWQERLLSVRSPSYLPAVATFWWGASNWLQKLTLPIRPILFLVFPRLRKKTI